MSAPRAQKKSEEDYQNPEPEGPDPFPYPKQEPKSTPPAWLFPKKVSALNPKLPPLVMKGLLYKGCRFVFGGSPKAKKSWLLMQACYCIANELPFLGIPTTQGKTLYLNFELLEGEARARFYAIKEALSDGDVDQVEVIQLKDKRIGPAELDHLKAIITASAFVMAAFDPVYKLMDGCDERIGKEVAPILAALADIGEASEASIGYAQHFTKGNQKVKFAMDRISGSNYFVRDADVILVVTELAEPDCFRVDIIQRSFPDIKPFGIRWQYPIFVPDKSIDIANIKEPGEDKEKTDLVIERMLAALHASNFEGGLTFTEFLRSVQVKGKTGNPSPAKSTFAVKLNTLIKRNLVEKSVATDKYLLTTQYASARAKEFTEFEEVVR
jgi:AAA domain